MINLRHITVLFLAAAAIVQTGCNRHSTDDKAMFVSQLREVNRLELGEMRISKTATIDDIKISEAQGPKQTAAALLDVVKIGDRKAVYSYDTYLMAYIDLSAMSEKDVEVDNKNKRVSIMLPPIRTRLAGRDTGIREEHYRVTGLRSQVSPEERAAMKEKMNEHLKAEMAGNSAYDDILVSHARERAAQYFRELLAGDGYTVDINFRQ